MFTYGKPSVQFEKWTGGGKSTLVHYSTMWTDITVSFLSLISRGVGGIQNCNTSISYNSIQARVVLKTGVLAIFPRIFAFFAL